MRILELRASGAAAFAVDISVAAPGQECCRSTPVCSQAPQRCWCQQWLLHRKLGQASRSTAGSCQWLSSGSCVRQARPAVRHRQRPRRRGPTRRAQHALPVSLHKHSPVVGFTHTLGVVRGPAGVCACWMLVRANAGTCAAC